MILFITLRKGLRTNKIAIPVGYFSGGNPFPEKIEDVSKVTLNSF
jgi:hypothetical protein